MSKNDELVIGQNEREMLQEILHNLCISVPEVRRAWHVAWRIEGGKGYLLRSGDLGLGIDFEQGMAYGPGPFESMIPE